MARLPITLFNLRMVYSCVEPSGMSRKFGALVILGDFTRRNQPTVGVRRCVLTNITYCDVAAGMQTSI